MEKIIANKRQFSGIVVKNSGLKTIRVRVDRKKMNTKYNKRFTVSRHYLVHDEKGEAKTGDVVLFQECRPLSKNKRWRLISISKKTSS